jgi:hypothetical protein
MRYFEAFPIYGRKFFFWDGFGREGFRGFSIRRLAVVPNSS